MLDFRFCCFLYTFYAAGFSVPTMRNIYEFINVYVSHVCFIRLRRDVTGENNIIRIAYDSFVYQFLRFDRSTMRNATFYIIITHAECNK